MFRESVREKDTKEQSNVSITAELKKHTDRDRSTGMPAH